ncbi:hypothetical protein KSP40_PGU018033 [Platanthera guangdongensis]|uniref:SCP domain-containing protein n=1 Tax=Platanthera guangdongensis TaxID=2320717 RepID=A0ABR2ME83_9ASPA
MLWPGVATAILVIWAAGITPITALPIPLAARMEREFTKAHNQARRAVGVNPLHWDPLFSRYAGKFAENMKIGAPGTCEFGKEAPPTSYGMNAVVTNLVTEIPRVVEWWTQGSRYYSARTNSCASDFISTCRAYLQVVWGASETLGCGTVPCGKDGRLYLCLYSPPGNTKGGRPFNP